MAAEGIIGLAGLDLGEPKARYNREFHAKPRERSCFSPHVHGRTSQSPLNIKFGAVNQQEDPVTRDALRGELGGSSGWGRSAGKDAFACIRPRAVLPRDKSRDRTCIAHRGMRRVAHPQYRSRKRPRNRRPFPKIKPGRRCLPEGKQAASRNGTPAYVASFW